MIKCNSLDRNIAIKSFFIFFSRNMETLVLMSNLILQVFLLKRRVEIPISPFCRPYVYKYGSMKFLRFTIRV